MDQRVNLPVERGAFVGIKILVLPAVHCWKSCGGRFAENDLQKINHRTNACR
jgi:hypothetical protein